MKFFQMQNMVSSIFCRTRKSQVPLLCEKDEKNTSEHMNVLYISRDTSSKQKKNKKSLGVSRVGPQQSDLRNEKNSRILSMKYWLFYRDPYNL